MNVERFSWKIRKKPYEVKTFHFKVFDGERLIRFFCRVKAFNKKINRIYHLHWTMDML